MDGWVSIGTRLDSTQLDKDLKQMEKDLKSAEKDEVKIKASIDKAERDLQPYEEELKLIKEITDESLQYAQSSNEVEKALSVEERMVESLNEKYSKQLGVYNSLNEELTENTTKQKELKNSVSETKSEIDKLSGINSVLSSANKQTGAVIKKVAKWSLAVFGVRSAYMGIRRVISMVRSENEEIDAGFKAIENFFTTAFEPVVKRLLGWVMTLVQYVNYLAKAWFGVDILAKSNEKSLKGANKQAKELRKTLTGFDEMNVINDSGGTGVAGATIEPLPIPEEYPIPSWLQWVADNGTIVSGILLGIAGGLLAVKAKLGLIKVLGIGIIIFGVINLIKDLKDYIGKLDGSLENNGTSWEDFGKIVTDVGLIILGIGILTGNLPLIIAGAITTIVGLVLQNWTKIKGIISTAWDWLDGKLKWLERNFGLLGELMTNPIRIAVNTIKNIFKGMFTSIKQIFDGILLIFKGDFKNGFISIAKGIANLFITVINTMINGLNAAITPFRALIVAFGKVTGKGWTMSNIKIPTIKYLKTGGIINQPNRGVSLGDNVRGGESGAEGVLPLTDTQIMETLGMEIGKNVSMTIIVENKMDGKVISREVKKINQSNDFVMNR